jgi:hypothetical protein
MDSLTNGPRRRALPLAVVAVMAATVPVSCADWPPSTLPLITATPADVLATGGRVEVQIGMPVQFQSQANDRATSNDVTAIELRLYAKNGNHDGFDYYGEGTVLYTTVIDTWTGGMTNGGANRYTFDNIPVSGRAYVVAGRAFAGDANVTRADARGLRFARSSNSAQVVVGGVHYSLGTALQIVIPLLDARGGDIDVRTSFTQGGGLQPLTGDDS